VYSNILGVAIGLAGTDLVHTKYNNILSVAIIVGYLFILSYKHCYNGSYTFLDASQTHAVQPC
jgi:hypothetical protein